MWRPWTWLGLTLPLAVRAWTTNVGVAGGAGGGGALAGWTAARTPNTNPYQARRSRGCNGCRRGLVSLSTETDVVADSGPRERLPGNYFDFVVTKTYVVPPSFQQLEAVFSPEDIRKKALSSTNTTVHTALMLLDPEEYPSQSMARRICRKGQVLILRREELDGSAVGAAVSFANASRALVGDRVYPGDVLARQLPVSSGYYAQTEHAAPLPALSVVYEDDHFAVVLKPAGYTVFKNYQTKAPAVQAVLAWSLVPPRQGTLDALNRPVAIHRLDKPTSGLLLVAKTKPAMVDLSRQFHDRVIQKTYMAVVNGAVPPPQWMFEVPDCIVPLSPRKAVDVVRVDVDPSDDSSPWYLIDSPLVDNRSRLTKDAVTVFRTARQVPSLHARDGCLSLVELKPKTGRYHQLRRHMAWVCGRVLVGDSAYDGNAPEAAMFRGQGLFLSSTRVKLEHPFYNSEEGRRIWDGMTEEDRTVCCVRNDTIGQYQVYTEHGRVMVIAEIGLPHKFDRLLERANDRFYKFSEDVPEHGSVGELDDVDTDEADEVDVQ